MEDRYGEDEYARAEYRNEGKTFWFSLLSALAVLAIVGLFLYAAQLNSQNNRGVQPGVGGGPPSMIPSPPATATPAPTMP